jgi:hypothetical protein
MVSEGALPAATYRGGMYMECAIRYTTAARISRSQMTL